MNISFHSISFRGLMSFFLGIVLSCASLNAQVHTIDRVFVVEPGGTLRMNVSSGSIAIQGWEYNEVQIQAEVYGTPRSLHRLELRLEQDGNDVIIRTRGSKDRWIHGRNKSIRFTIRVPFEYNVRINVGDGEVLVRDVDGHVRVRSSAGSFRISDMSGVTGSESTGVSWLGNVSTRTSCESIIHSLPVEKNATLSL